MGARVEIVNWYATRRHYATTASEQKVSMGARTGLNTLCGKAYQCKTLEADADFRRANVLLARDYAALPLCKFCERKAQAEDVR